MTTSRNRRLVHFTFPAFVNGKRSFASVFRSKRFSEVNELRKISRVTKLHDSRRHEGETSSNFLSKQNGIRSSLFKVSLRKRKKMQNAASSCACNISYL